jgi:hypothetical protein
MVFLSNIIFTDQDDIVPSSGVDQILNTRNTRIVNTLAGNDRITGDGTAYGFVNFGTLNTDDGNDTITGIGRRAYSRGEGISNYGTFNTAEGDDVITGEGFSNGISIFSGIFDTGEGNDKIRGTTSIDSYYGYGIYNDSTFNTGDGNDTIEGSGVSYGIYNSDIINTGNDDDLITGTAVLDNNDVIKKRDTGIFNKGTIDTSDGQDSIISHGTFTNRGNVFLGEGNDLIAADTDLPNPALENFNAIDTGNGDDTITSAGVIYNDGTINTGNSKDSIISYGGFDGSGSVTLGNGKDYLKGFGSGEFSGGNGDDTLELTSGTYTIGRWYTAVTFTKGSSIMIASEFEKLIAGNTIYDFTSLTKGQTITVA